MRALLSRHVLDC